MPANGKNLDSVNKARQSTKFYDSRARSDEDYAALPPLVKKGEDREAVLDGIVEKWITPSDVDGIDRSAIEAHVANGGFFLDGVALVDGNTGVPIDLGELLRRVEYRLKDHGEPEACPRYDLFILLRRCRVDQCYSMGLRVRPRFVVYQTTFGDEASFSYTTFGDGADFSYATFGDRAHFEYANFGDGATFEKTVFGDRPRFFHAIFGDKAAFWYATFGDEAGFEATIFGDKAGFDHANFSHRAAFQYATFGGAASFSQAIFGEDAYFRSATLGDRANFQQATFGDAANFSQATFGDEADFKNTVFGDEADFQDANFGDEATFAYTSFGDGADFNGATFGDKASLFQATFGGGAGFREARLPNADLRNVGGFISQSQRGLWRRFCRWFRVHRGFVPDETFTRGSHFSARPRDPWSKLRSAYTGPRLIFNLLFLAVFFLPFIARTAGWYAAGQAQDGVVTAIDTLAQNLIALEQDHPELAAFTRAQIEALRATLPGGELEGEAERWRESRVWRATLGIDKGVMFWFPALVLLLYNLGRGVLTFLIAPMRDAEERSGYTPSFRAEQRSGLTKSPRWLIWRHRLLAESYGWLIWPHRLLVGLLWLAIASFIFNAWNWLTLPLWLPT